MSCAGSIAIRPGSVLSDLVVHEFTNGSSPIGGNEKIESGIVRKLIGCEMRHHFVAAFVLIVALSSWTRADLVLEQRPARLKAAPDRVLFLPPVADAAPLTLDGKLDEPIWQRAAVVNHWIDRTTSDVADLPAEVRLVATPEHLYVGFTQRKIQGAALKKPIGGDEYGGSVLEMFFDPYGGKHRTKVQMVTSALGLRYDAFDGDVKWTGAWQSVGHIADDIWTIETVIPFADMRGQNPKVRPFWKANFCVLTQQGYERNHSWTGGWGDPAWDYGVLYFGTREQYEASLRPTMKLFLDRITYDVRDRAGVALVRLSSPLRGDGLRLHASVMKDEQVVSGQTLEQLPGADTELIFDVQSMPVGDYRLKTTLRRGDQELATAERSFSKRDRQVSPPAKVQGRVPVWVHAQPELAGTAWPISTGVPFSPGSLASPDHVRLLDPSGREVPCQTIVRSTWSPRGPVQWLGVDFVPTLAANRQAYTLEYGPDVRSQKPEAVLRLQEDERRITVDTGPLRFSVDRRNFDFINEAVVDGKVVVKPTPGSGLSLVDHEGNRYRAALDSQAQVVIEEQGPVRVTIRATGWYVREGSDGAITSVELPTDRLGLFTVRLSAFAGSRLIKAAISTTLTHDTDKVRLRELTVALPAAVVKARVGVEGGAMNLADQGYLLQHRADAGVDQAGAEHVRGEGWVQAVGSQGGLTVAMRRFWQLFPKEIGLRDGLLTIHPWPAHGREVYHLAEQLELHNIYKLRYAHQGRELDFRFPEAYRRRLDEAYRADRNLGTNYYTEMVHANAQGMNIHNDLLLSFDAGGMTDDAQGLKLAKLVNVDPHAAPEPEYACATGVMGPLLHAAPEFSELERTNLLGWQHLTSRHAAADDYGMFVYGNWNNHFDYVNRPMAARLHRVWCNGHYAIARAPYVQYLRTADPVWMVWGRDHSNALRDVGMIHYVSPQRSFPYHVLGATYHCKGFAPWGGDAHVAAHPICIDHLIYDYFLFGNRRSLDALNNWIEGLKRASPGGFTTREGMTTMAEMIEAYRLTWDSGLVELIERFRQPIVKGFQEQPSWDYHPLLLTRDWAFSGDPALLEVVRQAMLSEPEGNSPGGLQHHDAFFALLENDPKRIERWTTRLFRDASAVLDRPGQYGHGLTEVTWLDYIYPIHKQPYTLKALKQFGLSLSRPRQTLPAPVVLGSGKSWIALRETQDQAFPVTITSGQPTQADISVRVVRDDGTVIATGTFPKAPSRDLIKPLVLQVPKDGNASQYLVELQRHVIHDQVLWPVSPLKQEMAVVPAGMATELAAPAHGLRLYFAAPVAETRLTLSSIEKSASALQVLDASDRLLTRGSSSRYLGGGQEIVLPPDGQGPLSMYVTGLMSLRSGDTKHPFVFSVNPESLFQVNMALIKP